MQNQVNNPTFSFLKKVSDSGVLILVGIWWVSFLFSTFGERSQNSKKYLEHVVILKVTFVLYFIIFAINLYIKNCIYKNTTFELSDTSVKYRRDFFGLEQKSVRYIDIREVILKQNIVQKWYDIGSVELKVFAATSNPAASTGIELFDLKNYKEVYDFLLEKTKHNSLK
jgi:hypothetical protein